MTQQTGKAALARRDVLRALAAAGGAIAAAPSLPARVSADTESNDDKRKARYRATDHVQRFYAVNRYPTVT